VLRFSVVVPSFEAGGAERVAITLAEGLAAADADVRLIVLDGRGPLRGSVAPGVRVTDLGRRRARWAGVALIRALAARGPHVVVATQTHLNQLLCLLRPLLPSGTQLILREPTLRGLGRHGRREPLAGAMRLLYRRADLVVASSPAMGAELTRVLDPDRPQVTTLPNPVDVARLRRTCPAGPPTARPAAHVVVVGRLVALKAVDETIRRVARIPTIGRLTVVGAGPDLAALRALSIELGLGDRVRFTGHLADPAPVVADADALVVASRLEGMPNAVLEALAVGTPVIAADLPALHELAAEVPAGGLRLVDRHDLDAALGDIVPDPSARPRPSLLPSRYDRDAVVRALLAALS
jgi:glycosyltransferase involved in cell wall biosynthesis